MQKFYLIGEKDHYKATDMKKVFEKINVKPDVIFTEGTGRIPVSRNDNAFYNYLTERTNMNLPLYEHLKNVIESNKKYNKLRNLEGNLVCVEDYNFMSFQVCILDASFMYARRLFDEFKTLKGLTELTLEFWTLNSENMKILENYEYNDKEKEISGVGLSLLRMILNEFEKTCVEKKYSVFNDKNKEIDLFFHAKELHVYRDIRNEIFYENIINNLGKEEKVVIFLEDTHMPFFRSKFSNHTYISA